VGEGDAPTIRAWVRYKLRSAEWYIQALELVGEEVGFDRYVGVEMALDGALASLCGAFDAAVGGLIHASEEYQSKQGMTQRRTSINRVAPHKYNWPCVASLLSVSIRQFVTLTPRSFLML